MLIEIAGIPGSGKTTLYKRLGRELKRRDVSFTDANTIAAKRSGADNAPRFVRSKPHRDLLYRFTRFTTQNPDFFLKTQGSFGDASTVKFLFFLLCANFQMGRELREEGEMVFMDEAFLNHGVAIFPQKKQRADLKDLLSCAPEIDVVIYLKTPARVAFERVVERGGGTDEIRDGIIQKFGDVSAFSTRVDSFKAGIKAYEKRCAAVLTVDTTKDLDSIVKCLADDLLAIRAKQQMA